jgi:hypothetical protein
MPQSGPSGRRVRITKAESEREAKRQEYLLMLDTPTQALKPGGANELASVAGVPGRPEKPGQGLQLWAKGVLFAEPIAVVMRDAVTPETAERLLGIDRRSLARSIHAGYLPAIKLGTGTVPFLVRLRDVVQWVRSIERSSRVRPGNRLKGQRDPNTGYIGFEPWLVERLRHHYPDQVLAHEQASVTPYAGRVRPVSRGGRPQKMVAVEPNPPGDAESGADEKSAPAGADHAPAGAPVGALVGSAVAGITEEDRYRLPKWHPLWLRRPEAEAPARTRPRR